MRRALLAGALGLNLAACTMPKRAPTDADMVPQAGGTGAAAPVPADLPEAAPVPRPPRAPAPDFAPAVTPPQPRVRPAPDYPPALSREGVEGRVTARFTVDAAGRAQDLRIVRATHPLFAQAVRSALARWRFEPARDASGRPVPAQAQQNFEFHAQP
ncbi:energy transducer TonB [Xenophilus sp. Marseille-Q4582]|uniref:energy transducer TonB n=1 Tax=Xenophilus sp. Marseille-Q4582 TaxID=2866600 RepID=UPI001CE40003|nr:energy transducer TonB [Xenophilus sp. Marseille-Q4582]